MHFSRASIRPLVPRVAAALLLGGLGRLLLAQAPILAEGVRLRLDEALTLLAAIAIGPWWGVLAAFVANVGMPAPSSGAWPLEALIVGTLVRRGWTPVPVTAGFWVVIGGAAYARLVPVPDPSIDLGLIWSKQIINGALNAALAQAALSWPAIARWIPGREGVATLPLRAQIARAIVPLATLPVALLGLGLGRMYVNSLEAEGSRDLSSHAATVASQLTDYLAAAEGDVTTLAGEIATRGPLDRAAAAAALRLHHSGAVAFGTMLLADASGEVLATSTRLDTPRPTPGPPSANVADRAYFTAPATTRQPYLSNGFVGRWIDAIPIVAVSAPYTTRAGAFGGIAQGALSLDQLGAWLAQFVSGPDISLIVVDRAGRVVARAGPHAADLLSDATDLPWVAATAAVTAARVREPVPKASPARAATHVTVRQDVATRGWRVHLRQPLAVLQRPIVPFYELTAVWLLLAVAVAIPLASRVARGITLPIEALARSAEDVGRRPDVPHVPVATAPAEVQSLQRSLDGMVARLDEAMRDLDQKVRDRSAALVAAAVQHETIFKITGDGMLILDAERRVLEANAALCRMLNVDHEALIGTPFASLEPDVSLDTREGRRLAVRRHGFARFETQLATSTGGRVPVEVVVTAIPPAYERIYINVRDISERRQAEEARAELEGRLRQSQKLEAIGTLAGGIAHDFNNILAIIGGSAEIAGLDLEPGHPAKASLDQIALATARAVALVRQILTFSRRRDDQRERVAVGPIVREAADLLRSTLPAMVAVSCDVEDSLPAVQADPVQLQQVVMNLGVNAGHAMRDHGGALSIVVRTEAKDGNPGVQLIVRDAGTGMDRQTLERAFEPFFTTKPAGEGTGLGLAVVHGIVTSHGGSIDVASEPGRGTIFSIWLPAAAAAATETSPSPPPSTPAATTRARVLVVDDEHALVRLVSRMLERLGYEAVGSHGPREALDLLASGRPFDVVLSDLAMPMMTGIELADRIHAQHPGPAVILYSGRITDDDAARARAAGIAEILGKPFSREQLAAAMARCTATAPVGVSASH